jgi:hypothetical protein
MRRVVSIAAICVVALAATVPTVSAFSLDGCTMSVQSMRADGSALDSASGPGRAGAGTQEEPLDVDSDGSVNWSGTTGNQVIKNNSWHIEIFNIPTLFRGGEANADGDTGAEGTVDFGKDAPFRFTGLYFVSGGIRGDGGACDGSGWIKVVGDPVGTVPFLAGLVIAILGFVLLGWAVRRGSLWGGVAGGWVAGLGVATLLVIFSAPLLGSSTVGGIQTIGVVGGFVCAAIGRYQAIRRIA